MEKKEKSTEDKEREREVMVPQEGEEDGVRD